MLVELVGGWCRWVVEVLRDMFRDPGAWLLHLMASLYAFRESPVLTGTNE